MISRTFVDCGSLPSATMRIAMSRSVVVPTSFCPSTIGTMPASSSRMSLAASATDLSGSIVLGFFVIRSRMVLAIDPSSLIVVVPMAIPGRRVSKTIRQLALSLPQTYEDAPWGFPVFKVADNRLFALLREGEPVELTVKLSTEEREIARLHPWVRRASHVGRYGWVTATIEDADALETALEWLRESYYLKAPAKLRDAAFAD